MVSRLAAELQAGRSSLPGVPEQRYSVISGLFLCAHV